MNRLVNICCAKVRQISSHNLNVYGRFVSNFVTTEERSENEEHVDIIGESRSQAAPASTPVFKALEDKELKAEIPRVAYIETLDTVIGERLGLAELSPAVFAHFPRIDIIHQNVRWQMMWRKINRDFVRNRAEMPGGGRKPWPQKGTGRARQGSCRAPQWVGGGKSHGPRGPKTYYYMLPFATRLRGLCASLSAKYAQDGVYIVRDLDIPTDDPDYLGEVADSRKWGVSVLFVDANDVPPNNIALACHKKEGFTIMPLYALNVFSILKYDSLVFTLPALELLEQRIIAAKKKLFHTARFYDNPIHYKNRGRFNYRDN